MSSCKTQLLKEFLMKFNDHEKIIVWSTNDLNWKQYQMNSPYKL